jgi:hypothetical protein
VPDRRPQWSPFSEYAWTDKLLLELYPDFKHIPSMLSRQSFQGVHRIQTPKMDVPILVDCLKWTPTFELRMVMKKLIILWNTT